MRLPLKGRASKPSEKSPDRCEISGVNPDAFAAETGRINRAAKSAQPTVVSTPYPQETSSQEDEPSALTGVLRLGKLAFIPLLLIIAFFAIPTKSKSKADSQSAPTASTSETPLTTQGEPLAEFEPGPVDSTDIGHFLAETQINGVLRRGDQSRITLNGQTFRIGEIVSQEYGLIFIGFDKKTKKAVFEDPNTEYYLVDVM